jgi:hypothetical protein
MGRRRAVLGLGLLVAIAGCGGGSESAGAPLVTGTLTGDYKGHAFTPMFGFATTHSATGLIGIGNGPLNCDSPENNAPPSGINAVFSLDTLAVGSYSSVYVQLYYNVGRFEGAGSNSGSVTITSVTDGSVAGSIDYSDTASDGQPLVLSGSFEVIRCPG